MNPAPLQLEEVSYIPGRSYRVLNNVKLSDFFFWHFHPEIELVYITAKNGKRQVGTHIDQFINGDLVLIGSDIPHLNFDYQLKDDYDIIVIHLQADFLEGFGKTTRHELSAIATVLSRSVYGISFSPFIKEKVGMMMFELLKKEGFDQYTFLLKILDILSKDSDMVYLHDHPYKKRLIWKEEYRLSDLYRYIDQNYMNPIPLSQAAQICHLSKEAFCRYFKRATKQTFVNFLNSYRIAQAKRMMHESHDLTHIAFKCGFESLAYFSRVFKKVDGVNPSVYRQRINTKDHY